jgi:site-specific DNA recombinase
VRTEVCPLLPEPQRGDQEERQRLQPPAAAVTAQMHTLRRGCPRRIDASTHSLLATEDCAARMAPVRGRIPALDPQIQQRSDLEQPACELRLRVGRFDRFAQPVRQGLDHAEWATRRAIIPARLTRVEIDQDQVRVVSRLNPASSPAPPRTDRLSLQHFVERVAPRALQRHLLHLLLPQPDPERLQVPRQPRVCYALSGKAVKEQQRCSRSMAKAR